MNLEHNMSRQLDHVKPSVMMNYNAEVAQIEDVIRLTVGEPDFNTPKHIKEVAMQAIKANESHYTTPQGNPKLRQAMANFLAKHYDAHYNAEDEILVTVGASEAIYDSLTAILNEGDEVIVPTPIFPQYAPIIEANGGIVKFLDTTEDDFILKPEKLDQMIEASNGKVKAIILNYPSNPTGVTYSREELNALVQVFKKHELFVISDEIYSELTYGIDHVSMGELLKEQTILINGLSKSHAMTGWRVGMVAAPKEIMKKISLVHKLSVVTAPTFIQITAIEALEAGEFDAQDMKKAYVKRRDYLIQALTDLGFEIKLPTGAFYLFAKLPKQVNQNGYAFALDLAYQAKVAFSPGEAFFGHDNYVRISYAASLSQLEEAVSRVSKYLAKLS
ncbi:aminotransferase class I/II-fold pyridoxal phosphate-dependent enzyme [Holzapfeliella sp. He02]|uniref:Aminotransferase n=1 Tax=Holzapfeliella saturejae TaxID=3082953 RepID=A0ABU8SF87_9LACO